MKNIIALDGLRAIAALIVLISHISNELKFTYTGFGAGQIGVMIFFALSGYLMCYVTETKAFTSHQIYIFLIRRFGRVLPLYIFIVCVAYLTYDNSYFGIHLSSYGIDSVESLFYHLTFISGNSVLWTIGIEVLFYLIFPIIWFFRTRYKILIPICFLILLDINFFGIQYDKFYEIHKAQLPTFLRLFTVIHYFLLGVVCYEIAKKISVSGRAANLYFIISFALVFLSYPQIYAHFFGKSMAIWQNVGALSIIGLLVIFTTKSKLADCILGNPVMRFLGSISFSIYLTHMIAIQISSQIVNSINMPISFILLVIGFTLTISSLTFYIIERPARNLINRNFSHK